MAPWCGISMRRHARQREARSSPFRQQWQRHRYARAATTSGRTRIWWAVCRASSSVTPCDCLPRRGSIDLEGRIDTARERLPRMGPSGLEGRAIRAARQYRIGFHGIGASSPDAHVNPEREDGSLDSRGPAGKGHHGLGASSPEARGGPEQAGAHERQPTDATPPHTGVNIHNTLTPQADAAMHRQSAPCASSR